MKATTLNSHSQKKNRYALKSFLWGMLIAAVFIVPSIIYDKGMFLYYGDYNCQVIPFYQLMSDSIKSGNVNWSWYTDLGTSFVGGYSFYNLGSPFFWLMMPFPSEWIPYLMGPLTILKFGCCSLTAYTFLQRYAKNKNNAVLASMLYSFSGFAVYSMVFHFIDAMVFFPLLLTTLDGFIYEKKRGRFAFTVAVCAIVNYYFFVAEAVFCLIYWIVRMAAKNYRSSVKEVLLLVFEAVAGAGMALFILLPSMFHIIGNSRVSESSMTGLQYWFYENTYQYAEIFVSLFLPPEFPEADIYVTDFKSTWASISGFLPLFGMSGVFAILFNKHRNKWLRVFYAVCGVFMFVPILNSSFQMFTETDYVRWFFMLMLITALGSVTALEDPSTKWKKAIISNLLILTALVLIIGFTPSVTQEGNMNLVQIGLSGSTAMFWVFAAVAMINIAALTMFLSLYKRNRKLFNKCGAVILSMVVVINMSYQFIHCKIMGETYTNIVEENLLNGIDNIHIDDVQDWRNDVVTESNYNTLKYDKDSVGEYSNYGEIMKIAEDFTNSIFENGGDIYYTDDDNLNIFWQIPGVESFHSTVSSSVMNLSEGFDLLRTTLTNWPLGMYGLRTLFSVKYMFNHTDTPFVIEDDDGNILMPGWEYYDTQNGYKIYENENVLPIGFTFDRFITDTKFADIPTEYKHIAALDAMVVSADDIHKCIDAGMTEAKAEDYSFTEKEYLKFVEDRKKLTCYDFTRDNKGFEAKIDNTSDNDKWVFFSVPYDKGWKAKVNGSNAEIMIADFGLMAVKVPAGKDSTIRFDYHIQGMFIGAIVSVLFLALLVVYIVIMRKKDVFAEGKDIPENAKKLFDDIKKMEEENMMHVYKRVPVALESGFGSVAYDVNHKKYIDFTSGIGVNALGFANGTWSDAVIKQMNEVQHTSNIYYNTTQIQLAEMLCITTGFSKVFFANSGAEANECAIKIARKYGSDKYGENHTHIVTLENSFHGRTIATLAATGQEAFHKHFAPFTEGFGYAKANDMESIKSTVTEDTCAVMIELIQGEGGVRPLDCKFVSELAEFCQDNDILLIVDEIQTGMGRTGKLFCYENYNIKPDVITSAKALGGGLPLSACLCNEKLQDVLTTGTNGTTFGGNTIACAGAMKILDIVSDEAFLEDVRQKGKYMRKRIKAINGVEEVRGLGLMIGIVLEKDNAAEVQEKCAENGLLVLTAKNLIRLLPPLNIDYSDIDEGLDILEDVINSRI